MQFIAPGFDGLLLRAARRHLRVRGQPLQLCDTLVESFSSLFNIFVCMVGYPFSID
jgi:hypothetical protein